MPPAKIPFHTCFFRTGIDDLATGSDDLLGLIGFLFVTKYFLEKKRELKCFFSSWGHHWGLSCIYGEVYKLYFPYFTFMNYWLTVNLNHYEFGLITSISTHLGTKDLRKNTDNPDFHHGWSVERPGFFAALNIAFSVESCHIRVSWCTESNVCICQDNAEKKSGSTLFKDERRFYTFQFHTTLLSYAQNNNIDYVMICNFQISTIMAAIFRYW